MWVQYQQLISIFQTTIASSLSTLSAISLSTVADTVSRYSGAMMMSINTTEHGPYSYYITSCLQVSKHEQLQSDNLPCLFWKNGPKFRRFFPWNKGDRPSSRKAREEWTHHLLFSSITNPYSYTLSLYSTSTWHHRPCGMKVNPSQYWTGRDLTIWWRNWHPRRVSSDLSKASPRDLTWQFKLVRRFLRNTPWR